MEKQNILSRRITSLLLSFFVDFFTDFQRSLGLCLVWIRLVDSVCASALFKEEMDVSKRKTY